jgi:hypothetical protein
MCALSIDEDSIIVSSADAETFALWYAAWGDGILLEERAQCCLAQLCALPVSLVPTSRGDDLP